MAFTLTEVHQQCFINNIGCIGGVPDHHTARSPPRSIYLAIGVLTGPNFTARFSFILEPDFIWK